MEAIGNKQLPSDLPSGAVKKSFFFQIDFIRISHAIKITNLTMVFGAIIAVAISLAILVNFG